MEHTEQKERWRDELLDLAEKYCDHKKLKGDCLYHIFEPFIDSLLTQQRQEMVRKIEELKSANTPENPLTPVEIGADRICRLIYDSVLSALKDTKI